jgi:hypothetical protein
MIGKKTSCDLLYQKLTDNSELTSKSKFRTEISTRNRINVVASIVRSFLAKMGMMSNADQMVYY